MLSRMKVQHAVECQRNGGDRPGGGGGVESIGKAGAVLDMRVGFATQRTPSTRTCRKGCPPSRRVNRHVATIRLAAAANGRYVRNQFMDVARKALDSRVVAVGFGDGGVRRRSGGFVKRRRGIRAVQMRQARKR